MEITIDIDNPVPQFEQLIEQIKAAVTAGVLKAGDSLTVDAIVSDLEGKLVVDKKIELRAARLDWEQEGDEYVEKEKDPFKPEKKRQILLRLADFNDPRTRDALVRELQDFDEGIRYAAAEALIGIDDPSVREPLAQALAKTGEESNRLRVRIAEAFHQRNWALGEHAALIGQRPPTGFVVQGDRIHRS